MKHNAMLESTETDRLLRSVAAGDVAALGQLLDRHRPELLSYVGLRLDSVVRARVDPSDVVQETQIAVSKRINDYLRRRPMPFRIWLRRTAYERLLMVRRREVGAERRSVLRELPLPEESSIALRAMMLAADTSPSEVLAKREIVSAVRVAIARLSARDQEVLLLRIFDASSYEEIGYVLAVSPEAAKKRYGRALLRLHQLLLKLGVGGSSL